MNGERDLAALLAALAPMLHDERYAFTLAETAQPHAFATVRENEGLTVIAPDPAGAFARISLTVHSSLDAVGLTAAIVTALAARGIPANVVAGLHHDHLFVPWDRRDEALAAIGEFAQSGPV